MTLFPDFNKSTKPPTGKTLAIELLPDIPGLYEFACQMGMLRGKLIVD